MARRLNRIASRMWALAALITLITSATGLLVYYGALYLQLYDLHNRMPPKPRAELEYLMRTGQTGTARFFEIYDKYAWTAVGAEHLPAIAVIILISTGTGGAVAMVLARRISRPITAVAQAAARVSAGDRSVRVERGRTTGETAELIDSFNKMATDLDAYDRERTVLTAGVAHELRTPLTILKGRLHGLEDGVIEPSSGEARRLLRQVEYLLRIVEDLNTLAHADAGRLTLDLRLVDPGELLRAAVADLRTLVEAHGVRFQESYEPAVVLGDPIRLTQVFTNILTNAVKHAFDERDIAIALKVNGAWVVVSILDEGPGFNLGDEALLFTPFWRAGVDKGVGRPGSGMGLTLAAKIAEAHGGRITAENRRDRSGACFSVWLPLARRSRDAL